MQIWGKANWQKVESKAVLHSLCPIFFLIGFRQVELQSAEWDKRRTDIHIESRGFNIQKYSLKITFHIQIFAALQCGFHCITGSSCKKILPSSRTGEFKVTRLYYRVGKGRTGESKSKQDKWYVRREIMEGNQRMRQEEGQKRKETKDDTEVGGGKKYSTLRNSF